jgi:hypothetical protein
MYPGDAPAEGGIRNNASLSLELFAARATGDSVRSERNPRGFHDALGSESVFARDWAETRIQLTDESSARREDENPGMLHGIAAARRGMSPASPPGLASRPHRRDYRARRSSRSHADRRRDPMNRMIWSGRRWAAGRQGSARRRGAASILISKSSKARLR